MNPPHCPSFVVSNRGEDGECEGGGDQQSLTVGWPENVCEEEGLPPGKVESSATIPTALVGEARLNRLAVE